MGYGRNEGLGIKYWGGLEDYEKELQETGHETYTAVLGPVSSNWDRACELYAYIVGGTVDYGAAHAAKFGHTRYGKTYPGVYKDISDQNKVHLVGHSMGGQTIRALTQLLSEGFKDEINYNQKNISPLFTGGKHWIHSVTTIATPNDGTTLADRNIAINGANSLVGLLGILSGSNDPLKSVIDFKLDQWSLTKGSDESYKHYNDRVLNSDIWNKTKDIAPYDLTTYGSEELNKWVHAQPDVYYFSWTTEATKKSEITGHQIPKFGQMNPVFYVTGLEIGKYKRNESGKPVIDKSWWPNDGVVNTISQNGPKLGSSDIIRQYNGASVKGQWNAMPTILKMDHEKATGFFQNMEQWYVDYADFLCTLPE